jgi:hypothetical protein
MIAFDLKCICGCQFEGWFTNRVDFDRQSSHGMIACPYCGSGEIHKILSPVAIHPGSSYCETADTRNENTELTPGRALRLLQTIQNYVERNFENVGPQLAEESLKIHFGIAEPRNIRGVATESEEQMLLEEGIKILKIPIVKKSSGSKIN